MSHNNIYKICGNLGLEKQDIDGALAYGELKENPKNDQIILSEVYKAGSRYGTISISNF